MQLANQLELCLHKQTQIVATATCRVGSQEFHSWIASLPLVSLLFIVIPTPFLNFLNFIYIKLFDLLALNFRIFVLALVLIEARMLVTAIKEASAAVCCAIAIILLKSVISGDWCKSLVVTQHNACASQFSILLTCRMSLVNCEMK